MGDATTYCPFCGQPNLCGIGESGACWCMDPAIRFPAEMLMLLPAEEGAKRCVCRTCVNAFCADPDHFRQTITQN
ncbi:MAG: cysteine-rich CWC family protein [Coraliomargarita sp.]